MTKLIRDKLADCGVAHRKDLLDAVGDAQHGPCIGAGSAELEHAAPPVQATYGGAAPAD